MRIGIDLGGTKIEGAAFAPDGQVLARRRVPTPQDRYADILTTITAVVSDLEREAGGRGSVGIGHPGALSAKTGLIKNANSTCLNGRPFDCDIAAALGREVRFSNDANCLALSEATDGAASEARVAFGVILGTGVGGGIVVDGRLWTGANAIAGEWGHSPLPWPRDDERPGAPCYCGKCGCLETFLSGPALARDAGTPDAETAAARAAAGDAAAATALHRYAERLARGLATVINLLDPEVIVLGGGLGRIASLYDAVPRLWDRHVFSDAVATRLVPPRWGDASGVRGAAWLWDEVNTPASARARYRRDSP